MSDVEPQEGISSGVAPSEAAAAGGRRGAEPVAEVRPHVPPGESPAEATVKAILAGIAFGILFGAANAYLGLRAGLTISTSIPVAVMTVAVFRALRAAGVGSTILEANMSQTVGSASSSVASGVIFTLPALFLWGFSPTLLQMTLLALCGGLLGVLFMIPLRQYLIVREHATLPYPEGTACAQVLIASEAGGGRARNVFYGLGIGALIKGITGLLAAVPSSIGARVPFLRKGEVGSDVSAALFGVGYILGPRIAAVMVGGGLLSSLVIIPLIDWWGAGRALPLFPETELLIAEMSPGQIWNRYVRYIGAGAVATGGLITLVRSIPTMIESFRVGTRQIRRRMADTAATILPRTERDLSLAVVGVGAVVIASVMAFVPNVFGSIELFSARAVAAVLVVVFAFFFVTVSSRIVGLVGVTSNPTSGMTIATLLATASLFLVLGWTDDAGKMAALTVGTVVAIAASIAGDTSQDLKTGFLLGATPARQQTGELVGVLTSAMFVCLTVMLLGQTYGFGSSELPAPQATLMKLVIDGVLQQSLPWGLVAIGVGIAIVAEFVLRIPSLPFAVGVYLPVSTMVPVFLGGLLRGWAVRKAADPGEAVARRDRGVLLGSGLVGGEGLMGVAIAGLAGWAARRETQRWTLGTGWAGEAAEWLAVALFVGLVLLFARMVPRRAESDSVGRGRRRRRGRGSAPPPARPR
ncbi:MAG TPA: oligopeptide transporter, OPT family, partial [Thermoanaerobaculia bacterium]|nr:oligopeptide transporter, OPT family [Thermoanaerobaculia bacterium]